MSGSLREGLVVVVAGAHDVVSASMRGPRESAAEDVPVVVDLR